MTPPTADTDDHESHSRRAFLATTASLGFASLSGCVYGSGIGAVDNGSNSTNSANSTGGTPSGLDPTNYADQFKHRVNITKKGADNTGKQAIDDVLDRVIDNDTLVYFPPSRYKLNTNHRHVGLRNLGIIGQNAVLTHGRVDTIEGFDVTKGEYHGPAQHFKIGVPDTPHKGRFVFGGFTVDWRGKNEGMQILNHYTAGKSVIQNIRQVGMHSLGCQGPFRLNPATYYNHYGVPRFILRCPWNRMVHSTHSKLWWIPYWTNDIQTCKTGDGNVSYLDFICSSSVNREPPCCFTNNCAHGRTVLVIFSRLERVSRNQLIPTVV